MTMEVSNKIREIALKFIESPEMVDHLREDKLSINDIIEIILYSRAPLEDKFIALQPVYAELVEYNTAQAAVPITDDEWRQELYREYEVKLNKVIQIIDFTLKEIAENTPPGTIFLLDGYLLNERDSATYDWDTIPYSTFEAARKGLIEQTEKYRIDYDEECDEINCKFYTIMKWLPGDHGEMKNVVTWIVSDEGVVWFAELNEDYNDELKQLTAKVFYHVGWIDHSITHISIPFRQGDIVTIDNRPADPVCHAVIASSPDERYESGTQAIYLNKHGLLDYSSLKDDLMGRDICYPLFSCMLRLAKFTGELPEDEAVLHIISQAVKANPALGKDIGNYIYEMGEDQQKQTRQNKVRYGVTWEQLQATFGL